ncbi:heavy metal translocating P-type ATPase [Chryseolinea lacunae]|uniref:Heavy metal translocating P-type ATPase metal-binding domain-containing protein n=1 Tax=Chryseolinea lacunae TaxID=2801331 RepID=A0ABS1KMM4_9BACT|nr:heavy metal translocating P-type ATPase metal-binding domain-containing protein [Chryseolinea lacunae]MBL0740492.1 heavy metal translocating P-type ATPase metal-binding domain-containing protein [Chryseolinea lacunae]
MNTSVVESLRCFHCGEPCDDILYFEDRPFCCEGCKTVYEILDTHNLCDYYQLDGHSGLTLKNAVAGSYAHLDAPDVRRKLLTFDSPELSKVNFQVPSIHCVSCIWLLENLRKLNAGVFKAEVSFGRKTVTIDFDPSRVKLSELAHLMASVGYAPVIRLDETEVAKKPTHRGLLYKLVIAGFAFGNIMLFSFPEYLGLEANDDVLKSLFSWLNLALSVPVFFYSASEYFTSAWKSFRQRQINIDVPIAAGLLALFLRSTFDILTATGPGYLDSFSGLVFFLLIGRWFQGKTYESLAFDRDFKSYFPLAVNRLAGKDWTSAIIYELKKGDVIKIRSMEIVPSDAVLNDSDAFFDYSFVTGEAKPVKVKRGDLVYAGGRLIGKPVVLTVEKSTSQSHLTSLWNNEAFRKTEESQYKKIIDRSARKFTWVVMALAVVTAGVWQWYAPQHMWLVLTSVLMVACPCALALAAPFTYGSMLRVFGQHGFFLKNADVIERLACIDAVVFDKTGTVTHGREPGVEFVGDLDATELGAVKLLTGASTHPLSTIVSKSIHRPLHENITQFKELPGKGVQGMIGDRFVQAGSANFVGFRENLDPRASYVFIAIDNNIKGYFIITVKIRPNLKHMLSRLGTTCAALLSGDNDADRGSMRAVFPASASLLFNQDPHHKLAFIQSLQQQGKNVLMVGDGLNDSGALKQSNVGIAVSDDSGIFTPACDGILDGKQLPQLDKFMALAKYSSIILKIAFGISFFYNTIALGVAVTGHLTPLVAAILMPVSSISVVGFSTFAVNAVARRKLGAVN